MKQKSESIAWLNGLIDKAHVPKSIEWAYDATMPLWSDLVGRCPILPHGARLFRVRKLDSKPSSIKEVGAPPPGTSSIQRLNDAGQSVLYLSESPVTAIEECKAQSGTYCLSEWRVSTRNLILANGGMERDFMFAKFPRGPIARLEREIDLDVLRLVRKIFTLNADAEPLLYRWSIGCGMTFKFSHRCEVERVQNLPIGGSRVTGRFVFPGIAYASIRAAARAVNVALNDVGQSAVSLHHVQWIEVFNSRHLRFIDYCSTWDEAGKFRWRGTPAKMRIPAEAFDRAEGDSLYLDAGIVPEYV